MPNGWNVSRFLKTLVDVEEAQGLVSAMVDDLRSALTAEIPDFGQHLGYDSEAVESHSTSVEGRESGRTSDPDADWGKHETSGVTRAGKALGEGDGMVRLQAARDRRHAVRDPGRGVADAGVGLGGEGTGEDVRRADGEGSHPGGALFGVRRRPGPGQRAAEREVLGPVADPDFHRHPPHVARGEGRASP